MTDPLSLSLHQAQRAILLASDAADLGALKSHDRTLLAALDGGLLDSPLARREGADEALLQGLAAPETRAETLLLLEARERLWPGELARVQALLLPEPDTGSAAWWLAAYYPALPCPVGFSEDWQVQVWAARARWRRGAGEQLPEPWRQWVLALNGMVEALPVAHALWQALEGRGWDQWLPPLLSIIGDDAAAALVNGFSPLMKDRDLVTLMGLSCQGRFLPWLASLRDDTELGEPARRELQWLTGGSKTGHTGRQCWGEPLADERWPRLFRSLPLGFRDRLWHWCSRSLQGAPSSLQGGQWCIGK